MKNKTETNHTPGPWQVDNNIGRKSEMGIVADEAPCIIAIIHGAKKNEWPTTAGANARLIAAAPELLAALEALADCPDYRHINTHEMNSARAAIAAAKGTP